MKLNRTRQKTRILIKASKFNILFYINFIAISIQLIFMTLLYIIIENKQLKVVGIITIIL